MKENTYITITRQYGSGGREVSAIVAEKLGLKRYDRKIVQLAAEKLADDIDAPIEDIIEKSYSTPETDIGSLSFCSFEAVPYYNKIYREQAKAILKLAQKGSAVFLGRCADYILSDYPETYSFFIYADDDFRENRAKDHYGNASLKDLDKEDAKRRNYYAYYTGKDWGDPSSYDLMINTSQMSLEAAADLIIEYISLRQKA